VLWSVAEGARGRRWRWTIASDDALRHAGLIELDDAGSFARLELETAAGILTLHPDDDGALAHGNVVRHDGVQPITVAWSDGASVAIEGDPFGTAVAGELGRGAVVAQDLTIRPAYDDTPRESVEVLPLDERGVPILIDAREWPLEV
jgi:hypothetical protein